MTRATFLLLHQKRGLDDDVRHLVSINVRGRATVLEVAVALCRNVTRDADGRATVRDTAGELANVAGLVLACQAHVVVRAVHLNMLLVALAHFLDGSVDSLHTTRFAHLLGRVVGVAARTVPVTGNSLGMEADLDTPVLRNADEQETGHQHVVAHLDALAGSDLELPLRRHDLSIDTGDLDTGVHAGAVVRLDQVTSIDLAGANTAVVGALRAGETTLGPAKRLVVHVKERVLLFDTEPRLVRGSLLHRLCARVTVVRLVGRTVAVPAFSDNNNVVTEAERVGVEGDWAEVDIRIIAARRLV